MFWLTGLSHCVHSSLSVLVGPKGGKPDTKLECLCALYDYFTSPPLPPPNISCVGTAAVNERMFVG